MACSPSEGFLPDHDFYLASGTEKWHRPPPNLALPWLANPIRHDLLRVVLLVRAYVGAGKLLGVSFMRLAANIGTAVYRATSCLYRSVGVGA